MKLVMKAGHIAMVNYVLITTDTSVMLYK